MDAERGWDVWVYAGQDRLVVQEKSKVVGGEGEVKNKGTRIVRCNPVSLVPFSYISD
jgi:hypothetical protein